ncbi:hypothetical protein [Phenylobacterium sp.]|jgi:hypothetical protein|uniref:hypothetical protein n=1 Tax=Phenylobacterium sp. TaxID=1871053 RepID=UPI002F42BF16
MHFHIVQHSVWLPVMGAISGYALWRGGPPERLAAAANLAAWLITLLVQNRRDWFDAQWGILSVDIVFLGVLVWLALTRNGAWLLFAAAFQLLGVVTHLAIVADAKVRSLAYLRSLTIWSYLILAALGVGTLLADRRRRRTAPEREVRPPRWGLRRA